MAQKVPVIRGNSRKEVLYKFAAIVALMVLSTIVILPGKINKGLDAINNTTNIGLPRLPENGFSLGLDLQGGAHLIYKAKVDQIPDGDRASAVEGVRDVIEKRVRSLKSGGFGVYEPIIQTTRVGEEYRIIIELPGVTDVKEAISLIGATPILEFKEANTEPPRDLTALEQKQLNEYNAAAKKKINEALASLRRGQKFEEVTVKYSEDASTKDKAGDLGFVSAAVYPELVKWAQTRKVGETSREAIVSPNGLNIVKILEERPGAKQVEASHLLICFQGSEQCDSNLTKEQALTKINELKTKATPSNFATLVRENSTEPGAKDRAGDLGVFGQDAFVKPFMDAVWEAKVGTIIGPVETQFGYHLIYKKGETVPKEYHLARVFVATKQKTDIVPAQEEWKNTGLSGKQLARAEVTQDQQTSVIQVSLNFNDEGTKLFSDITTRNVGKRVAIFLDGEPISIPTVNEPITGGTAVISGGFTYNDARLLAQRLNSGALPVPVEILSQQKVDATLGADSLSKSFKAGVAGLLFVMLFLTFYYRLPGLMAFGALLVYSVVNLAIFKVLGVTLTLSGIAGFILSIGMAVDSNVLVFERLKEELMNGRALKSAVEEAFLRSWPSIRDGHVTTLIGALVLVWFGSGFVEGFAVVLIIGIIMSLFSAVTVTRTLLRLVVPWCKEEGNKLFLGYKQK